MKLRTSLMISALAAGLAGCGTIVQSGPLANSNGRALCDNPETDSEERLCSNSLQSFQLYALPVTTIHYDLVEAKDKRWTVNIRSEAMPDSNPNAWFRLYFETHPLADDNFSMTVSNGLLNSGDGGSTSQAEGIVTAARGVLGVLFAEDEDASEVAASTDQDASLSDQILVADSGSEGVRVEFGATTQRVHHTHARPPTPLEYRERLSKSEIELTSTQGACLGSRVQPNSGTGNGATPCRTRVGRVVGVYHLDCRPKITPPGRAIGLDRSRCNSARPTDADSDGQTRIEQRYIVDRRELGFVHMEIVRDITTEGDYSAVRNLITSSYRETRHNRNDAGSVYYRIATPSLLTGRFHCEWAHGVTQSTRNLMPQHPLPLRVGDLAARTDICPTGFGDMLRRLGSRNINNPLHRADIIVDSSPTDCRSKYTGSTHPAVCALALDIRRGGLGTRTTTLEMENGVLKTVDVEEDSSALRLLTLLGVVAGVEASDD